ncbi:MAG TPA: hypothetical protein VHI71_00890 [Actinomycetota bacterium]|nr:hypothetical protein [Actinomycetota bacterium]
MTEKMRELFIEELEAVVGGGAGSDVSDHVNTTTACCEEGPFGCCWWGEAIRELIPELGP